MCGGISSGSDGGGAAFFSRSIAYQTGIAFVVREQRVRVAIAAAGGHIHDARRISAVATAQDRRLSATTGELGMHG